MCTNMYRVVLLIRMLLFWQIRFRTFWPKKRVQTCARLFCCFTFFSDKYVFEHFDLKNVYNFRTFWPKKRVQTCTRLFCCFTFFSFFEWQDSPLFGARLTEKSKTHNCKLIWNAFSDLILHFLRSYPLF